MTILKTAARETRVAGVEKRRRLGKGDWGERVRDSLPFSLFPFLPLPLPFHCALACVAGVERGRGRGWDVQYAQPSL